MEIHLDSIGQAIIAFCVLVFLGFTHRNLAAIGKENKHIIVWPSTYIVRTTMLSWTIYTVALLFQLLTGKPVFPSAPLASAAPLFLVSLVIMSAFSYARIIRMLQRSPEDVKNALIQEQLLLQSVSQTQRNLSLKRNVNDARRLNLKSQMNPHFLFNILTGIQNLLMRNESEKASMVFSKFRKLLLTGFLSHDQVIGSLRQEISHIDQYLELEDIRLEKKINVSWNIHPNVKVDITPFPLFILQPLVENAIWHGLSSPAVEEPQIKFDIAWFDECLEIRIQDNGVGLQDSQRRQQEKKHHSRGTAIVKERLSLLHHSGELAISEASEEHPFSTGITALIRLPLWSLEPAWSKREERKAS